MKPKYPKIKRSPGYGTKSYGWDNGDIAFGSPLQKLEDNENHRKKERNRQKNRKKPKGDITNRQNFHRMHG